MKLTEFKKLIREEVRKIVKERDFSKADKILSSSGEIDPDLKKAAQYIEKLADKYWSVAKLVDILNALEITMDELIMMEKEDYFTPRVKKGLQNSDMRYTKTAAVGQRWEKLAQGDKFKGGDITKF